MKFGISLLAGFSVLLRLAAAAKNYASVEAGILDFEKKSGPSKKGDIYIFKEWWAPKKSNPEDIRRGYSHVRNIVLEITGVKNQLAKGRAFDVSYYKLDEQGNPATPNAADQVIDENGYRGSLQKHKFDSYTGTELDSITGAFLTRLALLEGAKIGVHQQFLCGGTDCA
jgi:hypothetical protein